MYQKWYKEILKSLLTSAPFFSTIRILNTEGAAQVRSACAAPYFYMGESMKPKLPFFTTLRLAIQGKAVTKILTVFLCAFSFALFALASTGFAYNKTDFLVRAYTYMVQNTYPYITFENEQGDEKGNYALEQERIDRIHAKLGNDFAYVYDYCAPPVMQVRYERFFFEEPQEILPEGYSLAGESECFEALGYTLLAGRYPERADEVVIPENIARRFQQYGYCDNSANYIRLIGGCFEDGTPYYDPETKLPFFEDVLPPHDYTGYYYFDGAEEGEREEIKSYADLLGKPLVLYGDPEHGGVSENSIYTATIVGVADGSTKIKPTPAGGYYPVNHFLFSMTWHDALFQDGDEFCSRLVAPPTDDGAYLRGCVELTLEFIREYKAANPAFSGNNVAIGAHDIGVLVSVGNGVSNERVIILAGTAAGILFGIFAVLLCWHLTSSSLDLKKRKIGVLRAMGANEADVKRIAFFEALFVAICSFALALVFTLAGFYGFLQPLSFFADFGVSVLQFNGWNVLILAGLSFIVPFLCTIVPTKKFLKQSIVDNISGNVSKA